MNANAQRASVRPATEAEIAAYRQAVQPHIGRAEAVEAVRRQCRMHVKFGSGTARYFKKLH